MKYLFIPLALLGLLLGLSVWNAATVEVDIGPWCEALSAASQAADREDWAAAERTVLETQQAWEAKHPYFHIVTAHDELDQADALFASAGSYAADREEAAFRAAVAELIAQLRVVAEMQRLTVKNVL